MISRNKLYEQVFAIDKRAAKYRKNKKDEDLKPYEKLFKAMSNNDIDNLLKFIDGKTNEYTLFLKRENDSTIKSSSSILMSIKVGDIICHITNKSNKSKNEIIEEHIYQLSYPKDDNFDEEYDFDLWIESSFKEQGEWHSLEAYKALCEGKSSDEIDYLEAEYLLENNLSDTVVMGDYENFIWEKHRLQNLLCKEVFEKNKDGIESFVEEKEMLDFLLEKIFPNQFFLQNMASVYKIPTKIYNEWAREGILKYLLPYIKPLSSNKML